MKFIDLTTKHILSKEKVRMGVSVVAIIAVSLFAAFGVYSLLESEADEQRRQRQQEAVMLLSGVPETFATTTEATEETQETALPALAEVTEPTEETEVRTDETSETVEVTSQPTAESTAATTEATTSAATTTTTAATTTTASEEQYYTTVYASQRINLRSGPGTSYDTVRTLEAGDRIDVVARTHDGWYKTINGNYVYGSYTQSEPPHTTAATTAATTTAATAAPTTAAPTTAATTAASNSAPAGMTYYGSCRITFYGPQPRGDGTYSTSTATGTTCSEGRTVAADWDVFPAGTTIYIANDPLGGDGYYTVEDRGSGVRGNHIDIYADDGESRSTTTCEVYVVN